jgi:hypothetical protein
VVEAPELRWNFCVGGRRRDGAAGREQVPSRPQDRERLLRGDLPRCVPLLPGIPGSFLLGGDFGVLDRSCDVVLFFFHFVRRD